MAVGLDKRVVGIAYAYNPGDEYALLKKAGIRWVRLGVPFPWTDRMHGKVSDAYRSARRKIESAHRAGLHVMPVTPGLGSCRFVKEEGRTRWVESWPEFCGEKGTASFLDNVRATCRWIAQDLGRMVGPLWQIMNEIDGEGFRGDYSIEQVAETARAGAEGVVSADADAMCGINPSHYSPRSLPTTDLVYRKPHVFAYVGDDEYFGSWGPGTVENWVGVLDGLYERFGLPVLANEWGYPSAGPLRPTLDEEAIPNNWPGVCAAQGWQNEVPGGHTEATAAEYLRRGLEIFATHPHCLGSFIFCWKDAETCWHCGKAGCPAECAWGIVDFQGKPKKAYWAVQEAVARYYGPPR